MRKVLLLVVPFLFVVCTNPNKNICCDSSETAFNAFKEAVSSKDVETLKKLTAITERGWIDYDEILKEYSNPTIDFLPKEPDGAYGIIYFGSSEGYYASFKDDGVEKEKKVIEFQKKGNCFQVINLAGVRETESLKPEAELENKPEPKRYGRITSIADGYDVKRVNLWSSTGSDRRVVAFCVNNEKVEVKHRSSGYVFVVKSDGTGGYCLEGFLK